MGEEWLSKEKNGRTWEGERGKRRKGERGEDMNECEEERDCNLTTNLRR